MPKFAITASGVIVTFNFWNKKPQHLNTYVVNFNIIVKGGSSISLHANVLQQIISPIWRGPLHQADVEFLQTITPERVADDIPVQSNSVAIDILVGLDYFWNIIDGLGLPSLLDCYYYHLS